MNRRILALLTGLACSLTASVVGPIWTTALAAQVDISVQQAVDSGVSTAADNGITSYVTVIDRATGKVIARSDNDDVQVAAESLVKVMLVAWYLVENKGELPADIAGDLEHMIVYSDDDLATAYWSDEAIPAIVQRYGLKGVTPAEPDPGHWGRTKVSADGLAHFMYAMSVDPLVGPWLIDKLKQTADVGADGYDQNYGFNRRAGVASKQGWGSDNVWTDQYNAVHSIGLTDRYAAAVLQTGPQGTYLSMGQWTSNTVDLILSAVPSPVPVPAKQPVPSTSAPSGPNPSTSASSPSSSRPEQTSNEPDRWWRNAVSF